MKTYELPLRTDNSLVKTVASYASGFVLIAALTITSVI